MPIESVTPVLNVTSIPKSFAWFEALGWTRGFAWNEGGMIEGAADANEHGEPGFALRAGVGHGTAYGARQQLGR